MTWEVGDLVYYSFLFYDGSVHERKGYIVKQLNEKHKELIKLAYGDWKDSAHSIMTEDVYVVKDFSSGLDGLVKGDILQRLK